MNTLRVETRQEVKVTSQYIGDFQAVAWRLINHERNNIDS